MALLPELAPPRTTNQQYSISLGNAYAALRAQNKLLLTPRLPTGKRLNKLASLYDGKWQLPLVLASIKARQM